MSSEKSILFSQRQGHTPLRETIQRESMDKELRTALWNYIYGNFCNRMKWFGNLDWLPKKIWTEYYKETIDTVPELMLMMARIKKDFFESENWYEVYDICEFIIQSVWQYDVEVLRNSCDDLPHKINSILEQENSAYRLVARRFIEMIGKTEIEAVEEAAAGDSEAACEHIKTAISLLSDRQNPDYRNSIKESISAVESLIRPISGKSAISFDRGLQEIKKKIEIHSALSEGFKKIYAYTSDESGVRHGLSDESNLTNTDAMFMLVTCSAFVNYLKGKCVENGIEIN